MQEILPNIVIDSKVRFGKPIIKGTRVPVDLIVGKIAGGMEIKEICAEYDLKSADVRAALNYAASLVSQESLIYAG